MEQSVNLLAQLRDGTSTGTATGEAIGATVLYVRLCPYVHMHGYTNSLTIVFAGARGSSTVSMCASDLITAGADKYLTQLPTLLARTALSLSLRALGALLLHTRTHARPHYYLHRRARLWYCLDVHWPPHNCVCGHAWLCCCLSVRHQSHPCVCKRVRLCHSLHTHTALPLHMQTRGRHHYCASYTITTSNRFTKKEPHE
jgi:hypothetical protein